MPEAETPALFYNAYSSNKKTITQRRVDDENPNVST
jgi:hypothetical protein